jgi:hypothetical protein
MRVPHELQPLAKTAKRAGWSIEETSGCHLRWVGPAGAVVITGSSPSSRRAVRYLRSHLRRAGLRV